jgi:lipopolysaccharide export LptBFGC system permease protein LptF
MGTIVLNHDTVLKDSVVTTDSFSVAIKRIDDTNKRIDDIIEANAELKKYIDTSNAELKKYIDISNERYYYKSLAAIYSSLTTIFLVIYLSSLAYYRSADITVSIGYHVIFIVAIVAMVVTIVCNFFASFISSGNYKRKK